MIFRWFKNGTPMFYFEFAALWTLIYIFLLPHTIESSEYLLKEIVGKQFLCNGRQHLGVRPWSRRFWRNGTNHKKKSGPSNCCPIVKKDGFLLSVIKILINRNHFINSKPHIHTILRKLQWSCPDMRRAKLRIKSRKKIYWAWPCIFSSNTI